MRPIFSKKNDMCSFCRQDQQFHSPEVGSEIPSTSEFDTFFLKSENLENEILLFYSVINTALVLI